MATAARTIVRTAEERVGRAAVIGELIGLVAFVGSWGGLGFGAMVGASVAGNDAT